MVTKETDKKTTENDRTEPKVNLIMISWIFAYLFFSPCGRTLGASGSRRLFFACASASSSHACSIGFNAIILLCDNVRLSNLQIVLCDSAPTPGSFRFANALPTSAWVTPSFVVNITRRDDVEEKEKRVGKKIKETTTIFCRWKLCSEHHKCLCN